MEEKIVEYIRLAVAYNARRKVFLFYREEIIEEATSFFCQEIWKIIRRGKYDPSKSALNTFCRHVVTARFVSFTKRYLNTREKHGIIIQRNGSNKRVKVGLITSENVGFYHHKKCCEDDTDYGLSERIREFLLKRGFLERYVDAFISVSKIGSGFADIAKRLGVTQQNVSYHVLRMKAACREYLQERIENGK